MLGFDSDTDDRRGLVHASALKVQRFGDSLNSHVHFHVLLTDRVFSPDPDDAEKAVFRSAVDLDEDVIHTAADQLTGTAAYWRRRPGYAGR